jgi:hypothetical protein
MVALTVNPLRDEAGRGGFVGIMVQPTQVTENKTETVVEIPRPFQFFQVFVSSIVMQQEIPDQKTARGRMGSNPFHFPVVRQRGDFPFPRYPEPCPATAQVPAGKYLWRIFPKSRRSTGAVVIFIPVGGKYERISWMKFICEKYQAHRFSLGA